MRALALVLSGLVLATAVADARTSRRQRTQQRQKQEKRPAEKRPAEKRAAEKRAAEKRPVEKRAAEKRAAAADPQPIDPYADAALEAELESELESEAELAPAPVAARHTRGQSIGTPWGGRLQDATRLQLGDGAHIRRPHRAFGTRTTVEYIGRAIRETLSTHRRAHVLAIGDLSAPNGGWISEHSSHRSGRDVDLGLFFKKQPAGYPASFVRATDETLDHAATWTLLSNLLESHGADGGVQMIFLDYDVQGMLYRWAKDNGVATRTLDRIFQYPNGRASDGIVRHEPNHADHFHVRYRCAGADAACY